MPFSARTRNAATDTVKIAGCVFAVCFNSSSLPSQHIFETEKPTALSASSNTARAAGYFSANSLPMPGYCDACPGNRNATLPMPRSSLRTSRVRVRQGELLLDFFVHPRARKPCGYAYRVLHGVGVGRAVRNHAHAADPQRRRAAVLRIVHRALDALERSPG